MNLEKLLDIKRTVTVDKPLILSLGEKQKFNNPCVSFDIGDSFDIIGFQIHKENMGVSKTVKRIKKVTICFTIFSYKDKKKYVFNPERNNKVREVRQFDNLCKCINEMLDLASRYSSFCQPEKDAVYNAAEASIDRLKVELNDFLYLVKKETENSSDPSKV